MAVSDNLTALLDDKEDITEAIEEQGGTVNDGDGFDNFATAIRTIPTGSGGTSGVMAFAQDLDKNIHGTQSTKYKFSGLATDTSGHNYKQLQYRATSVTVESEADIKEYLTFATGVSFLPLVDVDRPYTLWFVLFDGTVYQMKYTDTTFLRAYVVADTDSTFPLALKNYVVSLAGSQDVDGLKTFLSGVVIPDDAELQVLGRLRDSGGDTPDVRDVLYGNSDGGVKWDSAPHLYKHVVTLGLDVAGGNEGYVQKAVYRMTSTALTLDTLEADELTGAYYYNNSKAQIGIVLVADEFSSQYPEGRFTYLLVDDSGAYPDFTGAESYYADEITVINDAVTELYGS